MPRTARAAITLSEQQPRTARQRRGTAAVLVVAIGVVGTGAWWGGRELLESLGPEQCRVTASGTTFEWAPDQASNAAAITAVAVKRGLPPRAATIAIATAMQESKVRNVQYGDRDSLGLFQQRPSQGWGTAEQILDPEYSTNKFYDALVKVEGYTDLDIAVAAQRVQLSADGSAYARHEAKARVTASVLSGQTEAGVGCALDDPASPGDTAALVALLEKDFGIGGEISQNRVSVRTDSDEAAWAVASWAVTRASQTGVVRVVADGREWTRGKSDDALRWHPADGNSADDRAGGRRVVIHLT
ncbi:MAG: hypothetical protein ACRCY8_06095 [Dermatophilaceae bacterium]